MKVAVLCSRVRVEEKLLFAALDHRGVTYEKIDVRQRSFDVATSVDTLDACDIVLVRCLSSSRAVYLTRWLEARGVRTINTHRAVAVCEDKLLTSIALEAGGLPTPRTVFAFAPEPMIEAIESIGYPAVLKPARGSWGRLLARVGDRFAAEAILEHKATLGGPAHALFYGQDFVEKGGRDIRAMVVGDDVIYAIWRSSDHWITNTATGGTASACPVTDELRDLTLKAARAVGGDIVAVDLFQLPDGRLWVNEVNHTPEFHGSVPVVDVDIAERMVDYVLESAKETR